MWPDRSGQERSPPLTAAALCPCRPVLWRGHVLSRAASVLHLSLLWQDGLHGDVPAGPRHLGTRRNVHGGGECPSLPERDRRASAHAEAGPQESGEGPAHMGATFPDVGPEAQLTGLSTSPVRRGCVGVVTLGGSESSVNTPPGLLPCSSRGRGSVCRSHVHFRILLTSTCVKDDA